MFPFIYFNSFAWAVKIMGTFADVTIQQQLSSTYFRRKNGAVLVLTETDNNGIEIHTEGPEEEADRLLHEFVRRWSTNRETASHPLSRSVEYVDVEVE